MKRVVALIILLIIIWGAASFYIKTPNQIVPSILMDPDVADDVQDQSRAIIVCLASNTEPHGPDGSELGFSVWPINADAVFIGEMLGWHPTWLVAIDFSEEPPRFHETYGMEGDNSTVLFRKETPRDVSRAFNTCGVPDGGTWDGKPPFPIPEIQILERPFLPDRSSD